MAAVPIYPGSRATVPAPHLWSASTGLGVGSTDHTLSRASYWSVPGTSAAVARWYVAHPPPGFEIGDRGTWSAMRTGSVMMVQYVRPGPGPAPPATGAQVAVNTTQVGDTVEIRATGQVLWRPARPAGSFVHRVRSIDVHEWIYRGRRTSNRSWSITSGARVAAAVAVLNRLPAALPGTYLCGNVQGGRRYRVVLHTASGQVTVRGWVDGCLDGLGVRRHGHPVSPALDHADRFVATLGPHA